MIVKTNLLLAAANYFQVDGCLRNSYEFVFFLAKANHVGKQTVSIADGLLSKQNHQTQKGNF